MLVLMQQRRYKHARTQAGFYRIQDLRNGLVKSPFRLRRKGGEKESVFSMRMQAKKLVPFDCAQGKL